MCGVLLSKIRDSDGLSEISLSSLRKQCYMWSRTLQNQDYHNACPTSLSLGV
jgi:hypothetical protein